VTLRDFLETHGLLPQINSSSDLYICIAPETPLAEVNKVAENFRNKEINVAVDISGRKLSDQLKSLDKRNIPFVVTVGKDEIEKNIFALRNTKTREEKKGSCEELAEIIKSANS
jgi:histidyl-tRNA synthetase